VFKCSENVDGVAFSNIIHTSGKNDSIQIWPQKDTKSALMSQPQKTWDTDEHELNGSTPMRHP
jgi:hypothetical protein